MSLPQLDLLRGARVVGGERRRPRLLHGHGAEAARVSEEGKKRERRSSEARRGSLCSRGGARERGRGGGGHGDKALVAPVPSLWRQGRC